MRTRFLIAVVAALFSAAPVAAQEAGDYLKPVPGPIVRHFEPPPTPYSAGHRGIDIATPYGTDVVASASGIVHFAGRIGTELFVSVNHPDGIRTTYSFLSVVLVSRGSSVGQGDLIGRSGSGHAGEESPHLHFGALVGEDYIDPEPLLVRSLRRNVWRVVHLAPVEE